MKYFGTGVIVALFTLGLIFGSLTSAQADTSVTAIKSIPEKSHPNVSLEFDAYRVPGGDMGGNGYLFTGGAGFSVANQSLGVGCAYDEETDNHACAVGGTFGVANMKVRVGYSQEFDELGSFGTVGIGWLFGF